LGDEGYPERTVLDSESAWLLYVRGSLASGARRVAVVGSRDADESGLDLAHRFGDAFARAGVEVVSGGAPGHRQPRRTKERFGGGPVGGGAGERDRRRLSAREPHPVRTARHPEVERW